MVTVDRLEPHSTPRAFFRIDQFPPGGITVRFSGGITDRFPERFPGITDRFPGRGERFSGNNGPFSGNNGPFPSGITDRFSGGITDRFPGMSDRFLIGTVEPTSDGGRSTV